MRRRAAVLGRPIGHSQSPLLHRAAYEHLGLDIDYTRIDLDESGVEDFLAARAPRAGWAGWSVTMPLKAALVPHMDAVSARVRTLGVLNTVVFGAERRDDDRPTLHGENTDVDGIVAALAQLGLDELGVDQPGARERGSTSRGRAGSATFGVLGAGGTAAAVLGAAAELGYARVAVYARSAERAAGLEATARQLGLQLAIRPIDALPAELSGAGPSGTGPAPEALVSTLPSRAADGLAAEIPPLPGPMPLLDVAYDPWPSALATSWRRAGGSVASGLAMLLHQAVRQVELFTAATDAPAAQQSQVEHRRMVQAMATAIGWSP